MRQTLTLAGLLAVLVGCDDTRFGGTHGGEVGGDDYCAVQDIVASNCAGCHTDGGELGGLNLDDLHGSTVDVASATNGTLLVTPGNKEESLFYRKVAGTQGADEGGIMPTAGLMSDANIEAVGAWIDNGATTECEEADADSDTDADTDTDTDADADTDADTDVDTWCAVEAVLTADTCVSCHCTGCTEGYSFVDTQTNPYENLVGQNSGQWPAVPYVVPYYPEASLLYRKVNHSLDEGEGDTMPQFGSKMDDATVEAFETWINAGAPLEDCN